MVSKKAGKLVLWPDYFDSLKPRPIRRVSKKLAVKAPEAEKIAAVAKKLELNPVTEEARHPKYWWKKTYRVLVDKKLSKTQIIKKIGEKLAESS